MFIKIVGFPSRS